MKIKRFFRFIDSCIKPLLFLMNLKAKRIGMKSSHFGVASGNTGIIMNCTTARDMMKLYVEASKYPNMLKYMGADDADIQIKGKDDRKVKISTTMDRELKSEYNILAGKTGSYGSDYCVGAISERNGKKIVGVVMGASDGDLRFFALKELYDISFKILTQENCDTKGMEVKNAESAISCIIEDENIKVLFEQNADKKQIPASMTKVLSLLTLQEYINDIKSTFQFKASDMVGGSGNIFKEGDIITFEDAFYAMMLPSSNQAVHAVSRELNYKTIFSSKKRTGR